MDNIEIMFLGLFTVLLGACIALISIFYIKRYQILDDLTDYLLDYIANNEENQKLFYQIGGIFGSGLKGGLGLDLPVKQRGGKFKWQDIALELASQFFTKGLQNPPSSPATPSTPQTIALKEHKLSDKW